MLEPVYHLMTLGDDRKMIFQTENDRSLFSEWLGKVCESIHKLALDEVKFSQFLEAIQSDELAKRIFSSK